MNNGGRCGDARVLRHVRRYGFGVFGRDGRFLGRWDIGMDDRELQRYYQTSFKI